MSAVRRLIIGLAVVTAFLSVSRRAKADEPTPETFEPYEHRPEAPKPSSHVQVSTTALMSFGSFVGIPVTRGGLGVEVGTRYVSGEALLELGRTQNGLGAHRLEIGANLRTPILGGFRASIGPHVGYAMLVRRTEQNALLNALLGDIASFSIGMHAAFELSIPVSEKLRLSIAVRAMGELYQQRQGWEVGPTIGLHF